MRKIDVVVAAFGDGHPLVVAGWRPGHRRWERATGAHPVSRTFVAQCQRAGYVRLRLALDGQQKEFTVDELLA